MTERTGTPVLYRMGDKPKEEFNDVTLLGTPIPVAQSTISRPISSETFLMGKNHEQPMAEARGQVQNFTLRGSLTPVAEQRSIFNLDSLKGISGSVLDPSLQAAVCTSRDNNVPLSVRGPNLEPRDENALSLEEQEAEYRNVQIDKAELQLLEDAFSDLGCATSDADDATVPTKACATVSHAARVDQGEEGDSKRNDGTGTTVSSLSSTLGSTVTNGEVPARTSTHTGSSNEQNQDEMDPVIPPASIPSLRDLKLDSQSMYPEVASKNSLETRANMDRFLVDLDATEANDKENIHREQVAKSTEAHAPHSQTLPSRSVTNVMTKGTNPTNTTANPIFSRQPVPNKSVLLDQSVAGISCLHMSDVDHYLLDMVRSGGSDKPTTNPSLNFRDFARRRALRSRSDRTPLSEITRNKQTYSEQDWSSSKSTHLSSEQSHVSTVIQDPPINLSGPPGAPTPKMQTTKSSSEKLQVSVITHPIVDTSELASRPTSASNSSNRSSLLANSNCLMFCGAVCGQIQRQQLLIKHNHPKPINVKLMVSTGDEVFKLVDELGYLFKGTHSICLPPALEYAVHVAYTARYPLSWDDGYLQLSTDEPEQTTWKVRLIAYTNSCQLECSCCTRLSSNVYWTNAVKVPPPPPRSPFSRARSDLAVASVILTNYGARAAWICCLAEAISVDGTTVTQEHEKSSVVAVQPDHMVIGPKQSQHIVVTLKPGVKAARISMFYGDEVLRHQVRLWYSLPEESDQADKRHSRPRIRMIDLLRDFANESRFQTMELPNHSPQPIRPSDWRQALSQQLRLREHLVLNVYRSENENSSQPCTKPSSPNISSICVQKEAFTTPNQGTENCSEQTHQSFLPVDAKSVPLSDLLQLDPPECLRLSKSPDDKPATGKFTLRFTDPPGTELGKSYQLCCSVCPLSSVLRFDQSPLKFRPARNVTGRSIFRFCPPPQSTQHNDSWHFRAVLTSANVDPNLASLDLSFEFCATEDGLFSQEWEIQLSVQPSSFRHSLELATQRKVASDHAALTHTLIVSLEGQCAVPPPTVARPITTQSPSTSGQQTLVNHTPRLSGRSHRYKLGPLHLTGIPVVFNPIDSCSENLVSRAKIELYNSLDENPIFIQLELPKPPFHILKPEQTRFRILPNRLVRLMLSFQPVDSGQAESQLKITVMVLPPLGKLVSESGSDLRQYKTVIRLTGEMI